MLRVTDHKAAALGFLVAAAYWPGMLSPAFVPRWAVIALAAIFVACDPRAVSANVRWLMGFLIALAGLSIFAAPSALTGWYDFGFVVMLALVFVAGATLERLDDVMVGLGLGLIPSSILCITQFTGFWSPLPEIASPSGLFLNREILAEFAALVFVWAQRKQNWLIAAIALVPIALCQSRVAVLAATVGLLVTGWPKRWAWRGALMLAICLAVGSLLFAAPEKLASADHRLTLWGATALAIWHAPFGNGLGWFGSSYPTEMFAHSDALQMIAELGVGALVILAIPVLAFRNTKDRHAERALWVAICVECAISFPLHMPGTGFVAALAAGHLAGRRTDLRRLEHDRASENERRVRWPVSAHHGPVIGSAIRHALVSVRSAVARTLALRPLGNCTHPATAGAA